MILKGGKLGKSRATLPYGQGQQLHIPLNVSSNTMNNLIDTLLIFNKLSNDLGNCTIALLKGEAYNPDKTNQLGPDQAVVNCLMDMIIINSISFIDEYNKHFGVTTEIEYKTKIQQVKKLCKPIFKQINKWKDLRTIRNSFLAHNLRLKDRTMIFRKELNQNAPRGIYEVEFLNNLLQLAYLVISAAFKKELEFAKSTFKLNISNFNPTKRDENWKIIDSLKENIQIEIKNAKLDYRI